MEYYTEYLIMMKKFSLKYNNDLFNNIVNNFEYTMERFRESGSYNDRCFLEAVVRLTQEYLRQRGFEIFENEECLMCGS